MARIASVQVAGYYPVPQDLIPSIASLIRWKDPRSPYDRAIVFDPCAGDGAAVVGLCEEWNAIHRERFEEVANEMEGERAKALRERVPGATYADAFLLDWEEGDGAALAWLNSPYDQDPALARVELRWLQRFTQAIDARRGYLLFLIPVTALPACAAYLSQHYGDLRIWRFPEKHYAAFRQVLVFGRRLGTPLPPNGVEAQVVSWAHAPERLPVLPERCPDPMELELDESYSLRLSVRKLDIKGALERHRPWTGAPVGCDRGVDRLMRCLVRTAMCPKPTHVAMSLAAGAYNGVVLTPESSKHPRILAKAVFARERVTVDEKRDKDRKVVGEVQIEVPKLKMSILRLDDYTYHSIKSGTDASGSSDPAAWTSADVVLNYERSLADVLSESYPPLHNPADPAGQIALPILPRAPYRAQAQCIQAALKLLANGTNPVFAAEIGSGKTLMALYVIAAMHESNWKSTARELLRVGIKGRLPKVRRALVVMPPHLISTWEEQCRVVVPWARVQVLETVSDLEKEADIYLLNRETAKLGSSIVGVGGRCPRCGSPAGDAGENAGRRLVCKAQARQARNKYAVLAERLAAALWRVGGERVKSLLPRTLQRKELVGEPNMARVGEVLDELSAVRRAEPQGSWQLEEVLAHLARATGREKEIADLLDEVNKYECFQARGLHEERTEPVDISKECKDALERLVDVSEWSTSPPCGEPLHATGRQPRRYPLAKRISRKYRRRWQLLVADESHEFNNGSSAQARAAHRLMGLPGVPTIALTGSLCSGYASSVFANQHALSKEFRGEFGRDEKSAFVTRYGYRRLYKDLTREPRYGSMTDREVSESTKVIGESPGVSPEFVMRHLLASAIVMHKADLDQELPPITESPIAVPTGSEDEELLAEYKRLEEAVLANLRRDRFKPELSGRLLGALLEVPSYLERATEELGPFRLAYPESCGGELVAEGQLFPPAWKLPKERWLVATLKERLAAGEKVLVFVRHTGAVGLQKRLMRLIASEVTPDVVFLDAAKVTTGKREEWIRKNVIARGIKVCLVNARAVQTGLNCLVAFSTAVWYELDWSAICYRQANGRLHRIGQSLPVSILIPYHASTAQEVALDLVARKVTGSLQVDGLDMQAALEAAGASGEANAAVAAAMSIGEAVFKRLVQRETRAIAL